MLLNVNVPDLPYERLAGHRVTRLGRRHKAERVVQSTNPRGDTVYWVGAAGDAAGCGRGHRLSRGRQRIRLGHAACRSTSRSMPSSIQCAVGSAHSSLPPLRRRPPATSRPGAWARPPMNRHSGIGMTSQRTRLRMVERLRDQGIRDEAVLAALAEVPRHIFVDEALAHRAYEDIALPIGFGQTISNPWVVARMLELVRAGQPLGKVLEIGTGCGYQAALLSRLAREVYSRRTPLAAADEGARQAARARR